MVFLISVGYKLICARFLSKAFINITKRYVCDTADICPLLNINRSSTVGLKDRLA